MVYKWSIAHPKITSNDLEIAYKQFKFFEMLHVTRSPLPDNNNNDNRSKIIII